MAEKKDIQWRVAGIGDVEKSMKAVLDAVFEDLKNNASVKAEGPTRLFFPNGIELISVIFKLNADGIHAEVKIAGEKGIKSTALVEGESTEKRTLVPLPDATS